MTETERLLLFNQCKSLQKLYPDESDYYEQCCEILESGYRREYARVFERVRTDELSEQESEYVRGVLDVYAALKRSYDKLEDKTGIDPRRLLFRGFDGNHDSDLIGYTCYLLKYNNAWREVFGDRENFMDFDTHAPVRHFYDRMLERWQTSARGKSRDLTKEEILYISDTDFNQES